MRYLVQRRFKTVIATYKNRHDKTRESMHHFDIGSVF